MKLRRRNSAPSILSSRAAVSNLLRLLELGDDVKAYVERREQEMGHARALLSLTSRRQQIEVAALVAKKALSVRETEALVRRLLAPPPDDHGLTAQLGIAQEFDGGIKRIHVQMGDTGFACRHCVSCPQPRLSAPSDTNHGRRGR